MVARGCVSIAPAGPGEGLRLSLILTPSWGRAEWYSIYLKCKLYCKKSIPLGGLGNKAINHIGKHCWGGGQTSHLSGMREVAPVTRTVGVDSGPCSGQLPPWMPGASPKVTHSLPGHPASARGRGQHSQADHHSPDPGLPKEEAVCTCSSRARPHRCGLSAPKILWPDKASEVHQSGRVPRPQEA